MTIPALFAVVVGIGMIGQWTISLATGRVPELRSEPTRIAFHLAGEFGTALLLIGAGLGLLVGALWAADLTLLALGMLLYTVTVSPGYFAQNGQWPMVAVFGVLFIATLACIAMVLGGM